MPEELPSTPTVLIVDDQPINVKLLRVKLEQAGMKTLTASTGEACIQLAQKHHPDIILLDIILPGIDGIETCRQLKCNPKTQDIPIIFVTVKADIKDKLKGLDTGAYDFISKPVDLDEMLARVKNQLRIKAIHEENLELQHRLNEARHGATIAAVIQGIAHNLNNLLGVAIGHVDLIRLQFQDPERLTKSIEQIDRAVTRMAEIVRQLSMMAGEYQPEKTPLPLSPLLKKSIEHFRSDHAIEEAIHLEDETPEGMEIITNQESFESILDKILLNAWEAYPREQTTPRHISVHCYTQQEDAFNKLYIVVKDQGTGIPENIRDQVFEPFVSSKAAVGHGLGLTMARHTMRQLGGDISLHSNPEGGTSTVISQVVDKMPTSCN